MRAIVNKCINDLQGTTETLSGDFSGLTNVWEEICVQVQSEHSLFWDIYLDTIDSVVESNINPNQTMDIANIRNEILDTAIEYTNDRIESYLEMY